MIIARVRKESRNIALLNTICSIICDDSIYAYVAMKHYHGKR